MFELIGGGTCVLPDPEDNPDNHMVTHHEAGASISFEVINAGDAGGKAGTGTEIDDAFVSEWHANPASGQDSRIITPIPLMWGSPYAATCL
jgi:hypothetical protein